MTFRLAPKYEIQETDIANGHKGYRVVCTLKSITQRHVRWPRRRLLLHDGEQISLASRRSKCPKCGKESIIKGKRSLAVAGCVGQKGWLRREVGRWRSRDREPIS